MTVALSPAWRATAHWATAYRRTWRRALVPSLLAPLLSLVIMGRVLGSLVADRTGIARPSRRSRLPRLRGPRHRRGGRAHDRQPREHRARVPGDARRAHLRGHAGHPPHRPPDRRRSPRVDGDPRGGDSGPGGGRRRRPRRAPAAAPAALLVPINVLGGMAVATGVTAWSARQRTAAHLLAWQRFGVVPMMLFAGVYFPIDALPDPLRWVVVLMPLHHAVALSRDVALGTGDAAGAAVHLLYLAALTAAGAAVAVTHVHQPVAGLTRAHPVTAQPAGLVRRRTQRHGLPQGAGRAVLGVLRARLLPAVHDRGRGRARGRRDARRRVDRALRRLRGARAARRIGHERRVLREHLPAVPQARRHHDLPRACSPRR